ncbi:MAG: adenylate/guanylate cyclase domain-containing protein [Chthonomonas sp.]|nr:adenylate/guanylate cyclase domain-containing protein [Chthonomonas sp.]
MQDYHHSGQRILAAIMFTDIVGFSMLMGRDERGTMTALDRDFALMEQECALHGGQVIKRTGDGLLMYFVSASDAVQSALSMQQLLHDQARNIAPGQLLEHRMGIHLGDVVITENDVIGDGVNVAQRLQGEAKPGAICMSQVVYDTIKGKIKVSPLSLGTKHLKHIIEPVVVWMIPPIGGSGTVHRMTATPPMEGIDLTPIQVAEPTRGRSLLVMFGALVALTVAAVGVLTILKNSAKQASDSQRAVEQAAINREKRDTAKKDADKPATPPTTPEQVDPDADILAPVSELDAALSADPERLAAIAEFRKKYEFSFIAQRVASSSLSGTPKGRQFANHYSQLSQFMAFVQTNATQFPKDAPLDVMGSKIAGDGGRLMVLGSDGNWAEITVDEMQPGGVVAIANAIGQAKPELATAEVTRQLKAFQREFSLSVGDASGSGQLGPSPGSN